MINLFGRESSATSIESGKVGEVPQTMSHKSGRFSFRRSKSPRHEAISSIQAHGDVDGIVKSKEDVFESVCKSGEYSTLC